MLHRDVKPGNLLLARDGQVKVTDFGIAQSPWSEELTGTGALIGTMGYLAPERVSGAAATPAVDLYALGIVGSMPHRAAPFLGEPLQVALAHRDQPLPPVRPAGRAQASGVAALIVELTAKDRPRGHPAPRTWPPGRPRPRRAQPGSAGRHPARLCRTTRAARLCRTTRARPAGPPDRTTRGSRPGPRRMETAHNTGCCPSPARQSRPARQSPPGPGNVPALAIRRAPARERLGAPGRELLAGHRARARRGRARPGRERGAWWPGAGRAPSRGRAGWARAGHHAPGSQPVPRQAQPGRGS